MRLNQEEMQANQKFQVKLEPLCHEKLWQQQMLHLSNKQKMLFIAKSISV